MAGNNINEAKKRGELTDKMNKGKELSSRDLQDVQRRAKQNPNGDDAKYLKRHGL